MSPWARDMIHLVIFLRNVCLLSRLDYILKPLINSCPRFHPRDIRDETCELVIELWKKNMDGSGIELAWNMFKWDHELPFQSMNPFTDIKKPGQFESFVSKCRLVPVCPRREYLMPIIGYEYLAIPSLSSSWKHQGRFPLNLEALPRLSQRPTISMT